MAGANTAKKQARRRLVYGSPTDVVSKSRLWVIKYFLARVHVVNITAEEKQRSVLIWGRGSGQPAGGNLLAAAGCGRGAQLEYKWIQMLWTDHTKEAAGDTIIHDNKCERASWFQIPPPHNQPAPSLVPCVCVRLAGDESWGDVQDGQYTERESLTVSLAALLFLSRTKQAAESEAVVMCLPAARAVGSRFQAAELGERDRGADGKKTQTTATKGRSKLLIDDERRKYKHYGADILKSVCT